jgi:HTH-type transcriptional regulator/antitoxin HigA
MKNGLRPIHPGEILDADYQAALKELSALVDADPQPGTPDGDRLDRLATLVEAYEAGHIPIAPPEAD